MTSARADGKAGSGLRVAEGLPRRDPVADAPLQLGQLREAFVRLAAPDPLAGREHLEDAALARHECHLAELLRERGEQLLREPSRARQEAAAGAVPDLDPSSSARLR